MKHVVLLSFCLSLFGASFAQSLEIVDPVDLVEGNATDNELEVHWDVHNTSSSTKTVRASRELIQTEDGSEERFCWGPICYPNGTAESSDNNSLLVTIEPDSTNSSFVGYYEPEGTAGYGVIKYCFFDHFNINDKVCHTVTFCTLEADCAVGVEERLGQVTLGDVGPNPLSGNSSFTYQMRGSTADAHIVIYNMIGEQIKEVKINNPQGVVLLSSDDFESGVYFYALTSQGTVHATKKFVVSK